MIVDELRPTFPGRAIPRPKPRFVQRHGSRGAVAPGNAVGRRPLRLAGQYPVEALPLFQLPGLGGEAAPRASRARLIGWSQTHTRRAWRAGGAFSGHGPGLCLAPPGGRSWRVRTALASRSAA